MASDKKLDAYSCELQQHDFYLCYSVSDLWRKIIDQKDQVFRCRTIGILESVHGVHHISDIEPPIKNHESTRIQVSMKFIKGTKISSCAVPFPVQLFGVLEWNQQPVIYAYIVQDLPMPAAQRLIKVIKHLKSLHTIECDLDQIETCATNKEVTDSECALRDVVL